MKKDHVILHITDVHFSEDTTHEKDARTLALGKLADVVAEQPIEWQPSMICLTGDIGNRGNESDYELAQRWLASLMTRFSIPIDGVFICAGNHDVIRDSAKMIARPRSAAEADTVLAFPPISDHYAEVFGAYSKWAKSFGIRPYTLGEHENYLVGQRTYQEISFVALNTAWCSKDNADKGQLWVGLPQIRHLEANGQFTFKQDRSSLPVTVTLLHHPKDALHPEESNAYLGRPNTWDYLSVRSDVILSGHAHGEARRADTIAETALHFLGGAVYAGRDYFNNFRLLRIESGGISYKTFEFDSRSAELRWDAKISSVLEFARRPRSQSMGSGAAPAEGVDIDKLREKTAAHAMRILEAKSRAVKPIGPLPRLASLQVTVQVEQERSEEQERSFGRHRRSRSAPEPGLLRLPFQEALGKSRRTLLLGELGTGKSTLAASVVPALQSASESAIAFLIPARQLEIPEKITTGALLSAFSAFVSASVAPALPAIQIQKLLEQQSEITILLDGLDELDTDKIRPFLREFAAMPEHWPTIRVVATGRPIELGGTVYADWQIATAPHLTEDQVEDIFENEAMAEGQPPQESSRHAAEFMNILRGAPSLAQLVATPLAARLFYSRIAKGDVVEGATLGDLVYDAIQERLGGWARKDSKQKTSHHFETYLPDAESRAALLGAVALDLIGKERSTVADVQRALTSRLQHIGAIAGACGAEALEFFVRSGLVVADEHVQFPVQVFLQALRGIGIEENWASTVSTIDIAVIYWREIAFAAAAGRRKSRLASHLHHLKQFVTQLSGADVFVPAAAHIVSESKSPELGAHFIADARVRKAADIVFLEDAWEESAQAIATGLNVAGPVGFEWFYEKYLDPKYPFVQHGSALTGAVFREWARLAIGKLTPEEKQKIRHLVIPILKADTLQVHDIVASAVFLIPEVFEEMERLGLLVRGLSTPQFSRIAEAELRNCMASTNRQLCEEMLLEASSPHSVLIWMDYNRGAPPSQILFAAIRSLTDARSRWAERVVDLCRERLGQQRWIAVLRFALSHPDTRISAGAALGLYDDGERHPVILREPLVKALHDGGYVRRAEMVLGELLKQSLTDNLEWLAKVIHDHWEEPISGAHSGEFRLLLEHISKQANGPSLLAWCVIGLGEFVLPRYPEVRQKFRDLLRGPNGVDYRNALRQKLGSTNGVERRAAAAVLVTVFPEEESLALETVVRSTSGGIGMRWHEWEDYLLSIRLGPGPLTQLKSKLRELPNEAARFGYRLLLNNGVDLNTDEQVRALEGILENRYRIRENEFAFLKTPHATSQLSSEAKSPSSRFAADSAALLLQLHRSTLSPENLAWCTALTIERDRWNRFALVDQLQRLKSDGAYARAVAEIGAQFQAQHSKRLLLDMMRISLEDSTIWNDMVWRLMCQERVPMNGLGDPGFWLIEVGRLDPSAGKAIGEAAERFLTEWTKRPQWTADVYQWLAVLADEFVGIPKDALEKIIVSSRAIHREVTAALLHRLGRIPVNFGMNRKFVPHGAAAAPYTETELIDAARQMETFPGDLCGRLEATVANRAVSSTELAKIKDLGSNGALIASVLSFTQGFQSDPHYVILVFPLAVILRRPHQPGCIDRLLWSNNMSQYECLKADAGTRSTLLMMIAEHFATGCDIVQSASLLLDLRGYLQHGEIQTFIEHIVQHPYVTDRELHEAMIRWFVRVRGGDNAQLAETIRAIRSGLIQIVEKDPEKFTPFFDGAIVCMALALGFWILSGEEDPGPTAAFWRGLRTICKLQSSQSVNPLLEAFEILEPLLSQINPDLLHSAISTGKSDSDPLIRALFVIFRGFGGTARA